MLPAPLRKAAYAGLAVYGVFAALAPRLASALTVRMGLLGFENTGELEAEAWYLRAVRAAGVGLLAAGGTGLLLEGRADAAEGAEPAGQGAAGTGDDPDGGAEDGEDGEDGGPVDIDV